MYYSQILLLAFLVLSIGPRVGAQTGDHQKGCSENARKLLKQAWAAQPMNVSENSADPAKAEALYEKALIDSPKCAAAIDFLVTLLIRSHNYEKSNEYHELFLRQFPNEE